MPSARFAIKAILAANPKFDIRAASNEGASDASNDFAALKSAAALASKAAAALKPKLAACDKDTPGASEGMPTTMASRLLREARQAQGILVKARF